MSLEVRCQRWLHVFPFLAWLPGINRHTLTADLMAGITGAIVVLPQGVAFATIAGMPPEYGLYAGMIPAIIAALFGSSWHLVSGPTTAASVVLFSSLSTLAEPGTMPYVHLALTLTFMVGLLELVMGVFRLGTIVTFISHAVVIGFTAGAGVLIAANQVKNFFGVDLPRGAHFHEMILYLVRHLDQIHGPTTMVGVTTLAVGILTRRFWPRLPYMIVAILAGGVMAFGPDRLAAVNIPTVGALPAGLPPMSAPVFTLETWRTLAPTALAMTLFALTEALSISRALAARSGQVIDGNQEFIGQGLSNLVGAFFSGYAATGSFNRSGLNYEAGARTPLAALLSGLLLMLVVVLVAPYAAFMPNAAMAGVLFLVAWRLIDRPHIRQILRASRSEAVVLGVTFFATLFLDLELAILAGVILSVLLYLSRTSRPRIVVRVPDPASPTRKFTTSPTLPECPQLRIIRVDGSLFFGAVGAFQETLRSFARFTPERRHLMIIMSGVNFIDVAGGEALAQVARDYRNRGGGLYLLHVKDGVREQLEKGGWIEDIGADNFFVSKTAALRTIYRRLDHNRCQRCDQKVFIECARLGRQEPENGFPESHGEAA
ncbi:MAG: high affinity sulfate transporter 1 [Rhodospirillaceae bacterium]|nr:MAG: high affinity sulfate transporter 1 [Rhodospirillaceae bacterium]